MSASIVIRIASDVRGALRGLDQTASRAQRTAQAFRQMAVPAAGALGAIGVAAKQTVDAASDVAEAVSKNKVIFGQQAGEIENYADRAAKALGQSKVEALDAASTFGLIGSKAGLSGSETAAFAKKFTGLASDLASFNNTTPAEAIEAIGAAMRGEAEPIRKYGVLLDDATLRQRALALGLVKTTKESLTPQQKALAASQEILAQTGKAQGDFARTSDGAANKQRILAAQVANLKAQLGAQLLPAMEKLLGVLTNVAGWVERNQTTVKILVAVIGGLAAAVLVVNAGLAIYTAVTTVATGAAAAFTAVMAANPIVLVVAAVAALVAGLVILYKNSETARKIIDAVWSALKTAVLATVEALRVAMVATWEAIKTAVIATVNALKTAVTATWSAIKTAASATWGAIRTAIVAPIAFARDLVVGAWNRVRDVAVSAWNRVAGVVSGAVTAVVDTVTGLYDAVIGAIGDSLSWLYNAGRDVIQGFIDGLASMFDSVRSKLGELTGFLPDWKGPADRDRRILEPSGRMVIEGFIRGIRRGSDGVKGILERVTGRLSKIALAGLREEFSALREIGRDQDRLTASFERARDRLKTLRDTARDYAASIRDSVVAYGAVTALGGDTGYGSFGQLVDQMRQRADQADVFERTIAALRRRGLNQTSLQQLLDAGVEGGLGAAQTILSGGAGGVAQVNRLARRLARTGQGMGDAAARSLYGAGIGAARALVAELARRQRQLNRSAREMARVFAEAVSAALAADAVREAERKARERAKAIREALAEAQADGKVTAAERRAIRVEFHLTAEQLSQLERGRRARADLDVFDGLGGRTLAVG